MQRLAVAGIAVFALAAPAQAAAPAPPRDSEGHRAHRVHVSVTPRTGGRDTHFLIRFEARNELRGRVFYDVEATGPEPAPDGCDNDSAIFRHARRGDRVRVSVPSRRTSPDWCPGRYEGVIWLEDWRHGEFGERDKVVGEFSFEVTASPSGAPRSARGHGRGGSGTG